MDAAPPLTERAVCWSPVRSSHRSRANFAWALRGRLHSSEATHILGRSKKFIPSASWFFQTFSGPFELDNKSPRMHLVKLTKGVEFGANMSKCISRSSTCPGTITTCLRSLPTTQWRPRDSLYTHTHPPVVGLIGTLHCSILLVPNKEFYKSCILRSVWKDILCQLATFSRFLLRML